VRQTNKRWAHRVQSFLHFRVVTPHHVIVRPVTAPVMSGARMNTREFQVSKNNTHTPFTHAPRVPTLDHFERITVAFHDFHLQNAVRVTL
jgi:hypothetical protein